VIVGAAAVVANRVVPLWLRPQDMTGDLGVDAAKAMTQRYLKADGQSLTQFNTGALVVREDTILAITECQPQRLDPKLTLCAPKQARAAVITDVRRYGPPLLAVLFEKGAIDVSAWVCCTADEVVLNGPAGPRETALLADVDRLRALPGNPRDWQGLVGRYRSAEVRLDEAAGLFAAVAKLAAKLGLDEAEAMQAVADLRHAGSLTFALAEPAEDRP
jgi:hypothetical protein